MMARLVSQEHDDLLARGAAKAAFGAFVCDTPAHWTTSPVRGHEKAD